MAKEPKIKITSVSTPAEMLKVLRYIEALLKDPQAQNVDVDKAVSLYTMLYLRWVSTKGEPL